MQERILSVRFCKVLSIDDDTDADRIKVELLPEDNSKKLKDIEYAFPLLPKIFHVKPKVGEAVLVLLAITNDGNSQRYYIGPIISQDHKIYQDSYLESASAYLKGNHNKFDVAPRMNPSNQGLLPKDDEIWIRGRKNTDIQITEDDIRIKAGVKLAHGENNQKMSFNEKNPGYTKIKYHLNPLSDGSCSTTSIVSDKILLLSYNSIKNFKLTDKDNLIPEKEYNEIIEKAYKLPYGEILIDFLNIFVKAFVSHTHPFSMLPPDSTFTTPILSKKDELLDKQGMLSDTVRIN